MNADGFDERAKRMGALFEGACRPHGLGAQLPAQAQAGSRNHGLGGVRQQRQIGGVVANVVESAAGQLAAQAIKLVFAGEVGCAVAAQNAREDAEMIGHALGKANIGAGGEIDLAAFGALRLKVVQQFVVVRQVGDVECDRVRDERLEGCLAF